MGTDQHDDAVTTGSDPDALLGRKIANCKVLRKLGQGAMGAVYLAEQISLRRTVALKVLDAKFSRDLTYIERFEREAQAAARLGHFNIVQVFDFGREGDLYYIVSEYVDGGTVQEEIEARGLIPPERSVDIILQACRGLAAAQEHSIVHRDIKPENLMLTSANAVKIADFGLAKVVSDNAAVTQAGIIVGTPFYMSPEQAKGQKLDGRSDIYSLGVTFFHMVTGQIPFDADSVIGVLLKQISAERPDPVAINPSLPAPIGPIVLRMMSRSPEERYQTASELIPTLQQLQQQIQSGDVHAVKAAAGREAQSASPGKDRFKRYKLLPASQIQHIALRDADPAVAGRMRDLVKGDTGVFIQTDSPFPVNSIVELQFVPPGQDKLYVALGLVRWISDVPENRGEGITFLKVNSVPLASLKRPSGRRKVAAAATPAPSSPPPSAQDDLAALPPAEKLKLLTQSQIHTRMLRYYYANTGQVVQIGQVANALGVGRRMMDEPLRDFEQLGLVAPQDGDLLSLIWPEDEELQQAIVNWIKRYGLL